MYLKFQNYNKHCKPSEPMHVLIWQQREDVNNQSVRLVEFWANKNKCKVCISPPPPCPLVVTWSYSLARPAMGRAVDPCSQQGANRLARRRAHWGNSARRRTSCPTTN